MRKYLFFLAFVAYLIAPKAQTTVWSDNFDDEDISNWTLIDSDGDGFFWDVAQLVDGDTGEPIGTPVLTSVSWSGFPLTPDNWAISPAIDLTGVSGNVTLKWFVFASDPLWNDENYGVYVSTTNTAAGMIAAGELFTEFDLPSELEERTLDLSSFAGQTVYVGFRHYDVTDQFRIGIDDVSIIANGTEEPSEWSCDLEAALEDPALGGPVWDRVTATGTVPAFGGTDVSYHVYGPFTVDTDGDYVFYSDQSYDTADEWDGFLLLYHTEFNPADGTVNFVAGNDDATGTGLGTSGFTASLVQGTEYFLVTTAYASDDFGAFVNTITGPGTVSCGEVVEPAEGCLEADNGQYPSAIYVPSCNGTAETITSAGWTGEYSMVTVTSGEEYIFSVSDPSYFITIGNEAGDAVIASGTGSVTWTANVSGNVRFYTHFTSACDFDSETFLTRFIQCGEVPPPPADCEDYEILSNNLENGLFLGGDTAQHLATDIPVGDTGFTIYGMEPTLIGEATSFEFIIYDDNAGIPGTQLETRTGSILGEVVTGNNFGFDFIKYTVGFDSPLDLNANTTYWIEVISDADGWETTTASAPIGHGDVFYNTNTANAWTSTDGDELVFNLICEEIVVEGCLDAPYGQYPSGAAFVPECQGEPEAITEAAWTGEYSLVAVTAGTEYIFSSSIETDFVTISNADGTVVLAAGVTPLTWTANAAQDVRFYLHLDAECNSINEGLRSRIVQCGEFTPPTKYCIPELDCTDGDVITNVTFAGIDNNSDCSPNGYGDYTEMQAEVEAGETYSMSVTVGAGWDYEATMVWIDFNNDFIFDPATEYFFIGSDPGTTNTADITIPAGTPDGEYRLRVRVGAVNPDLNDLSLLACDEETVYGETEDYTLVVGEGGGLDCFQEVLSNNLENGLFLGGADNQRLAVDVIVEANTKFTIESVDPTIIIPEGGEATTFDFIVYSDEGGLPGTELETRTGTITGSTVTGQNFGRDFIRYNVELSAPIELETGTYWLEMTSDAEGWEATTADVFGSTLVFNNASTTGTWVNDGTGTELVYKINGTCETLGVSDMDSFDFAYYPNPVKDELNITSQKVVQSVSVYNLAGQQVSAQKLNATNGKVSTSSLAPGVYVFKAVLEGGQVETFKVVKK